VSRILRDALGGYAETVRFARRALFAPTQITTATLEPDASGTFLGSSFAFLSPRDWARLGQLHLQDGVWSGARVLPEGWVDTVTRPTPASAGRYGAHWWINRGHPDPGKERDWPSLPHEVYLAWGHSGQYVMIDPTAELVVVRLGLAQVDEPPLHAFEPLVRDVRAAITADRGRPESSAPASRP